MFRRVADFQKAWEQETGATLKVLGALTDASLARRSRGTTARSGAWPGTSQRHSAR